MRPSFTGLWKHPDFLKLWAGQTVSTFGSLIGWAALQFTAILWLDATPLQVSVLAVCQLVAGFVLGLAAGVWADRLRRRPILIVADTGRALALATIPSAALLGVLGMEQLYLVALVTSALTVCFDVAYEAYLPALVGPNGLVEGNSKLATSASVAEFGGFSLSGWLVQLVSAPGAVLVDALSFVWSACFIGLIRVPEPTPVPHAARESLWREARAGMGLVWRSPILRPLAGTGLILHFCERIVGVTILLYLSREAGFSPGVLGVVFGVGGVTALAGAVVAGRWSWFGGLGPALVLALVLRAAGACFIPLAGSASATGLALLVASQIITDPAWSFYQVNEVSLRQAITPDRLRGRMNATMRVLGFGAMLAGTIVGGLLAERAGLRATLWVAVGGMFGSVACLLLSPVAALRDRPPVEAPARSEQVAGG